jgi:hypothetical protein
MIELVVVGAHLSGMPLNGQLKEAGARFCRSARTAASYKLYELAGQTPPKPGLVRVGHGGTAIEIEVWRLGADASAVSSRPSRRRSASAPSSSTTARRQRVSWPRPPAWRRRRTSLPMAAGAATLPGRTRFDADWRAFPPTERRPGSAATSSGQAAMPNASASASQASSNRSTARMMPRSSARPFSLPISE